MAAIRSFSTAAVRPLGSGATWRTIVKRQRRSELKLYNEFAGSLSYDAAACLLAVDRLDRQTDGRRSVK